MKEYTRQDLIKICEKAFVNQKDWGDRDSASSQLQMAECYALLRAGCYFEVTYKDKNNNCITDEKTIWVQFWVHDFQYFEYGGDAYDKDGHYDLDYQFYLPTLKRLKEVKGKDWY